MLPFADALSSHALRVVCEGSLLDDFPADKKASLFAVLREDPRPAYQNYPERVYGFPFAGYEIKFYVSEDVLYVTDIFKL